MRAAARAASHPACPAPTTMTSKCCALPLIDPLRSIPNYADTI
jgi:hypothetical protein